MAASDRVIVDDMQRFLPVDEVQGRFCRLVGLAVTLALVSHGQAFSRTTRCRPGGLVACSSSHGWLVGPNTPGTGSLGRMPTSWAAETADARCWLDAVRAPGSGQRGTHSLHARTGRAFGSGQHVGR